MSAEPQNTADAGNMPPDAGTGVSDSQVVYVVGQVSFVGLKEWHLESLAPGFETAEVGAVGPQCVFCKGTVKFLHECVDHAGLSLYPLSLFS